MTTMMLELAWEFHRIVAHAKILDRCGLAKLAYARNVQLDLSLLIVLIER